MGDRVEFVVSSGANAAGDITSRHIQIFAEPVGAADWSGAKAGIRLDLAQASVIVDGHRIETTATDAIGSSFNDVMSGDASANGFDGGAGDDRLFGMDGDDILQGGSGADRLDGGPGADRMTGGLGDDTYYVDDARDQVIETDPGGGIDTVRSEVDFVMGANIERLYLVGESNIGGAGNGLANILYGNEGDNVLSGGGGADKLYGGGGSDIFLFDVRETAGNADTIMDFQQGIDRIAIDRDAFADVTGLAYGSRATSGDMTLFYDPSAGTLYFDADGNGMGEAVALASLRGTIMMEAADVLFV